MLVHSLFHRACFIASYKPRRIIDAYLRGVGVALVSALEEGYLITRGTLETVVDVPRRRFALIHLQPAYVDVHADEFAHPSRKIQTTKMKIILYVYNK